MPKVSVIIPIYDVEKYLPKCLESVINQTLKDIEIICVNDCSADNCENIVLEYSKRDDRIKIVNNETNSGIGFSRNRGIEESDGEYISFIDADDYIENNYLEILYDTAVKYNADIVFTNNINIVRDNIVKPYYHNRIRIWKKKFKNNWKEGVSGFNVNTPEKENTPEYPLALVWNKIFRKNFLYKNKINFMYYRIGEDVDFFYRLLCHNPKMVYNNKAKYYYFQRTSSLMTDIKKVNEMPLVMLEVFENVFNYYKKYKKEFLIDCNYYNFLSFLHTFNNYKADNKNEFYKKSHLLMKELGAEIDAEKHPFFAYSLYIMKTCEDYSVYLEKVESAKKKVFSVAWWIPSITLREKYKKRKLDEIAKGKFKELSI